MASAPKSTPNAHTQPPPKQQKSAPQASGNVKPDGKKSKDEVKKVADDIMEEEEEDDDDAALEASTSGRPGAIYYKKGMYIELGRIVGAHGIKGGVRVEVLTDNPKKRFGANGKKLYLLAPPQQGLLARSQAKAPQELISVTTAGFKVQPLSEGKEAWILQFDECADRTKAEELRQYTILMLASERERLSDPDEFYAQDLDGCKVYMQDTGRYVGDIVDVLSGFGSHDNLKIQLRATQQDILNSKIRTSMIPFVKALVPVVDKKAKVMRINPPEGLLDLVSTQGMKKPLTDEQKYEALQRLDQLEKEDALALQAAQAAQAAAPAASGAAGEEAPAVGAGQEAGDDEEEEEGEEEGGKARTAQRPRRPRAPAQRRRPRLAKKPAAAEDTQ